jgi:transposase
VAQELKRKGVTLTLLWQEYRTAHPDGYGYTCGFRLKPAGYSEAKPASVPI